MTSAAAPTYTGWSVRCAACGSCCNSAPVLSLPELFRHRDVFVGALGLRRMRRIRTGDHLGRGRAACQATDEDEAAYGRIAADCLHPLRGAGGDDAHLLVAAMAFDDPGLGRCPALGADARCTLHDRPKPIMCSAVPFDPLLPDGLQHLVLAERWAEADDLGARCIARTAEPERTTVHGAVLDEQVRHVLAAGRRAWAMDKRIWGDGLVAQLRQSLAESSQRVPSQGFLVIPLTPVLERVAAISPRCRERCLEYLDAQLVLGDRLVRKPSLPGASVTRLRTFLGSYHRLRGVLLARPTSSGGAACDLEHWLEGGAGARA
jgi:hypothetical protein